jgi:pyridoxal phosphate-dependent aminotransferase EpsN
MGAERELVADALDSNWIAPLGPHVDGFERELAAVSRRSAVAALSSGTAALHLALKLVGVGPGDEVLCSSLTFSASANAIVYQGATPVFIDCDRETWNIDPDLLAQELAEAAERNHLPKALIAVDLYGQCADYDRILPVCAEYGVAVIEDAAEALGATYRGQPAGSFGAFAVLSFNGNKIITTSGGGALLSDDEDAIARARFLATQARDPAPHYEHSEIGYNYRLSNILAAIGRAQLETLSDRVEARRRNFEHYSGQLGGLPGLEFMPEADYGRCTRWLTCLTIDPVKFGVTREDVRLALEKANIESRPVWKPMHMQPVFRNCRFAGREIAERLFLDGLCLPSGSCLRGPEIGRVISIIKSCCARL